jgi:hypothetical protein
MPALLRLISLRVAVVSTESMSRDLVACVEESKFGILAICSVIKDCCRSSDESKVYDRSGDQYHHIYGFL